MPQTGPKTDAGKRAASRNAVKHGIYADAPIISVLEKPADWQRHLDGMIDSLKPEGWHESFLASRIAALLWRLLRTQRYETKMIDVYLDAIPNDMAFAAGYGERALGIPREQSITLDKVDHQMTHRMLPDDHILAKIMRYEAHLHRQYLQTAHELEAIQLRRQGGHAPLTRLDISAPPGL